MSAELHKLAVQAMFDADVARRDDDGMGEAAYCTLAAHYEQRAIDSLKEAGLGPERPRTLEVLERSRDALNVRASKALERERAKGGMIDKQAPEAQKGRHG